MHSYVINHSANEISGAMQDQPAPRVFVCILNWNKPKDTLAAVQSALEETYPNLRVLVVDNGSTDNSRDELRKLGSAIDLIEHEQNLGFTGGCNAGIRHALERGADYVWLLNNDTEFMPGTLSQLVQYAERDTQIGMVSPVIADRGSKVDSYVLRWIDLGCGYIEETTDRLKAEAIQDAHRSQVLLKGTALLLKRALIEAIGLLDERFFAYCEDNDYSVRCAAAGFRAACVATATVFHDEAGEGEQWRKPHVYYYATRNGFLFWRKYARGLAAWKYARWHMCTMFRVLGQRGYEKTRTEAFADGLWSGVRGVTGRWEESNRSHHMPVFLRRIFVSFPELALGLLEAKPGTMFLFLVQMSRQALRGRERGSVRTKV